MRMPATAPLLSVHDATVQFGGLRAVQKVSVEIETNSIAGLIGPNGAGKTTLFNAVSGLQRLDSGQVYFRTGEITGLSAHKRAALGIGRTFQTPGLMSDQTVEYNISAAQYLRDRYSLTDVVFRPWRQRSAEAIQRARTEQTLSVLGLDELRETPVADLSFGLVRRVELAALLVQGAELLLLDEPTTGLDLSEAEQLAQVIRELRQDGRTVFLVAHDIGFVLDLCDHVFVMAEGQIIYSGVPSGIQADQAVVDRYLGNPR